MLLPTSAFQSRAAVGPLPRLSHLALYQYTEKPPPALRATSGLTPLTLPTPDGNDGVDLALKLLYKGGRGTRFTQNLRQRTQQPLLKR